jgi:thiosulfate reductase cytochrome b subunit
MDQRYPSSGPPNEPGRPPAPVPVLTAVKLMYVGAAISTFTLIISLALIPAIKAALGRADPSLTTAQVSDVNTLIALAMVFGLVVVAVWLWMARATGQGQNWARILSTVLFGLATMELIRFGLQYPGSYLAHFAVGGQEYWVIHSVFGVTVLGLIVPVLLWLTGLAAVWLLWRPASSAFFR